MRDKNYSGILFVIFLIFGLALALQYRTTLDSNRQREASVIGIDDLRQQLDGEIAAGKELRQAIDLLEKENESYLKAAVENKDSSYLKLLKDRLDEIKIMAGLTEVKGTGVTIKLDDAPARKNVNPNLLIIHDTDIVRILNELKKAGAQAISINGERIIGTSEQVCAGPTIKINESRYAVPYIINAIGNTDIMYEALNKSDTVALMIRDSIKVEITKMKNLTVSKYNIRDINNLTSGLEVVGK